MRGRAEGNVETSLRSAFELLIQMRGHKEAGRLLRLANSYLRVLLSVGDESTPVVVSVRTVKIREP